MPNERDPTTYGPYRYPEAKNHSFVKNDENPPQIVESKARRMSRGALNKRWCHNAFIKISQNFLSYSKTHRPVVLKVQKIVR
jgi:hypothetical protein